MAVAIFLIFLDWWFQGLDGKEEKRGKKRDVDDFSMVDCIVRDFIDRLLSRLFGVGVEHISCARMLLLYNNSGRNGIEFFAGKENEYMTNDDYFWGKFKSIIAMINILHTLILIRHQNYHPTFLTNPSLNSALSTPILHSDHPCPSPHRRNIASSTAISIACTVLTCSDPP